MRSWKHAEFFVLSRPLPVARSPLQVTCQSYKVMHYKKRGMEIGNMQRQERMIDKEEREKERESPTR